MVIRTRSPFALLLWLSLAAPAWGQDSMDEGVDLRDPPPAEAEAPAERSLERTERVADDSSFDKKENFGAVVAPAVLPSGASAAYGFVGAPAVGAAYRQGLTAFEIEGRASFNYLMLSFAIEGIAKVPFYREGGTQLAVTAGIGLLYDTGSRYFDVANFEHFGIRPRVGAVGTFKASETLRIIASVDVPWDISASPGGAYHVTPLAGGGVELYLGEDISGLAMGQLGADIIKEPQGVPQARVGFLIRVGLGFRFF